MNAGVGIGLYIIIFIIGIFIWFCGLMSAFIIPNHLHLVGWDWIYMFISCLGLFWGGSGASLVTIVNRKD